MASTGAARTRARPRHDPDARFGLILLTPAAILITLIVIVPIAFAVCMAFLRIDLTRSTAWTFFGLGNFAQVASDPLAAQAILRSIYFAALAVVGTLGASLGVALLLNERFHGNGVMRVVSLIPWAVSPLAAGTTWFLLFDFSSGGLNGLLVSLGILKQNVAWLGDAGLALHAAALGQIWLSVPLASLLMLARLQSTPSVLYRAAVVDGANVWQRFRYVTLPSLRTTLIILALIETIISLQTFDLIYSLTRGGPALGTVVFNFLIYQRGFVELRLGYAAALGLILFAIVVVASLVVFGLVQLDRVRVDHTTRTEE